jgi:hypothetical protein
MRPGRVSVGACGSTGSALESSLDGVHNIFSVLSWALCDPHQIYLLLSVLSTDNFLSAVQEIVELSTVDFVERDLKLQVRVLLKVIDDVVGGKEVKAGNGAVRKTHHGESLARSGLSVGKTSRFSALEGLYYKGVDALCVDLE